MDADGLQARRRPHSGPWQGTRHEQVETTKSLSSSMSASMAVPGGRCQWWCSLWGRRRQGERTATATGKKSAMIFDVLQVKTRARWKNPGSRCRQLAATSCWVQTVATQTGKFPAREPLKACQDQQVPKIFDSLICSVRTCLLGKRTIGSERAQDPPSQGPNSQGPAPPEPEQQEVQVQRPTSKRGRALLVS
jgi:hypothetical protein